ncbi:MAG: DNA adenine methylase [Candidatus Promineifilaceae bacterium]
MSARPFLKWAGGKARLLGQYAPYLPAREAIGRYYEPFIGSAAVFFQLGPRRARLSDVNRPLIELYRCLQQDVEGVIACLRPHRNEKGYYYGLRAADPAQMAPAERAARLIYLNRTGYNGLYRENRRGQFNVPFGRYAKPTICDPARLRAAARALQGVELAVADFAAAVALAGAGDFVYFDPPYAPLTPASFTAYDRRGFGPAEQARLAETFHALTGRGARAMLSNSSAPLVYELYAGRGYRLVEVAARRNINSRPAGRGPVKELLILNWA